MENRSEHCSQVIGTWISSSKAKYHFAFSSSAMKSTNFYFLKKSPLSPWINLPSPAKGHNSQRSIIHPGYLLTQMKHSRNTGQREESHSKGAHQLQSLRCFASLPGTSAPASQISEADFSSPTQRKMKRIRRKTGTNTRSWSNVHSLPDTSLSFSDAKVF